MEEQCISTNVNLKTKINDEKNHTICASKKYCFSPCT